MVHKLRGVITDWGGVLTTPILTTVQAWIQADSIDWDSYRTVMPLAARCDNPAAMAMPPG